MIVVRRTFKARGVPAGPERDRLQADWLTSDYMPSYKYGVRNDDGSPTPFTYRKRAEAEARAALMEAEEVEP